MIAPVIASPVRPDPPLRLECDIAGALEEENREVEDLVGVLEGRYPRGRRPVPTVPLATSSWPPAPGVWAPKDRSGAAADFAVRQFRAGEGSLEELVLALYCGSVSVARADRLTKALWGTGTDLADLCRHADAIRGRIDAWRRRPIVNRCPYVFLAVLLLKVGRGGAREWRRVFAAVGVSVRGIREVLSVRLAPASHDPAWREFLADLRERGLGPADLFVGENEPSLIEAVAEFFPGVPYQGDFTQMEREVLQETPAMQMLAVASALAAARSDDSPAGSRARLVALLAHLRRGRNAEAAARLSMALPHLFHYGCFPRSHWGRLRTNRPLLQVMRDCRELIRGGGADTSPEDLLLLVAARWRRASRTWARRRCLAFAG